MKVIELCRQIEQICRSSAEIGWANAFSAFIEKIESIGLEKTKNEIRSIYGGTGSFNDLVLYENGQVLTEKNNNLDKLRRDLFVSIA